MGGYTTKYVIIDRHKSVGVILSKGLLPAVKSALIPL